MIQLALTSVAVALVCSGPLTSVSLQTQAAPKAAQKSAKQEYPTFEPFLESRMFKAFFEDVPTLDLEEALKQIETIGEIQETAKRAAGDKRTQADPQAPSALLQPELDGATRSTYMVLPVAMMKLEPMWTSKSWTAEQLTTAQSVSKILARIPEAPKLDFAAEDQAANRKQLEELVRWFHGRTAEAECYGAMIPTMDDGPYQGLPHEAKAPLEATEMRVLEKKQKLDVRLCKIDRPKEPWVLQGVREGKVLWSRVVSGAPDESVSEVALRGEPKPLGTYGWLVPMSVKWTYGSEQAYLYVDAKGNFLFYFMSW